MFSLSRMIMKSQTLYIYIEQNNPLHLTTIMWYANLAEIYPDKHYYFVKMGWIFWQMGPYLIVV